MAWAERELDGSIKRIAIGIFHAEGLLRVRSASPGLLQRHAAFRKRLVDWVTTVLYGSTHLPAFLPTGSYHWTTATGNIIPFGTFDSFTDDNNTLSVYLKQSNLNSAAMNKFIRSHPTLKKKKQPIHDPRDSVNIKPGQTVA